MTEYEHFWLVFTKTRVYKFGHCSLRCPHSLENLSRGLQPWRTQDDTLGRVRKIWPVWFIPLITNPWFKHPCYSPTPFCRWFPFKYLLTTCYGPIQISGPICFNSPIAGDLYPPCPYTTLFCGFLYREKHIFVANYSFFLRPLFISVYALICTVHYSKAVASFCCVSGRDLELMHRACILHRISCILRVHHSASHAINWGSDSFFV
jgi:hypothetical protein